MLQANDPADLADVTPMIDHTAQLRRNTFNCPKLTSLGIDSFKRLFEIQIDAAKRQGIPEVIITNSICQHLDPMTSLVDEQDRFKMLRITPGKLAIHFLRRIETQYVDMYGTAKTIGKDRRIRRQFLDGFVRHGVKFLDHERETLMLSNSLADMALCATDKMDKKMEKIALTNCMEGPST